MAMVGHRHIVNFHHYRSLFARTLPRYQAAKDREMALKKEALGLEQSQRAPATRFTIQSWSFKSPK
jgi:hypothetical protein